MVDACMQACMLWPDLHFELWLEVNVCFVTGEGIPYASPYAHAQMIVIDTVVSPAPGVFVCISNLICSLSNILHGVYKSTNQK